MLRLIIWEWYIYILHIDIWSALNVTCIWSNDDIIGHDFHSINWQMFGQKNQKFVIIAENFDNNIENEANECIFK